MKRLWNIVKRHGFVLLLAAVLLCGEGLLRLTDPVKYMTPIWRDDFELLQLEHPEQVWDKIFFGSSAVTASYIEGRGDSGYINAGIDYGTIRDLWEMIDKGYAQVGSEIVLGINELSFLDTLPTNPTYAWHRAWYEPYLYFQRDRLYKLLTDGEQPVRRQGLCHRLSHRAAAGGLPGAPVRRAAVRKPQEPDRTVREHDPQ